MLPKKEKFTAKDLSDKNLFRNSKKIYVEYGFFVVLAGSPEVKYGIILSKKNFKTAVSRNRHKRLFYNTLQEIKKTLKNNIQSSIIFHPKKTFTKQQLFDDLIKQVFLV